MNNEVEIQELNIQPQAGVIGVFSRLNYKAWYAIAEFVDNSTQSFYSHQQELSAHGINDVDISINYDSDCDILTITDTAYGMEFDDFARAVKVDSPPEDKTGRNEFGMGLKTAACWFGNLWTVETTRLGKAEKYFADCVRELMPNIEQDEIDNALDDGFWDCKYSGVTNDEKSVIIKEISFEED